MDNRKTAAGLLAIIGMGIAVSLILFSKKETRTGKIFMKKTKQLTEDLKGKFGELVDQVSDKMRGVLK